MTYGLCHGGQKVAKYPLLHPPPRQKPPPSPPGTPSSQPPPPPPRGQRLVGVQNRGVDPPVVVTYVRSTGEHVSATIIGPSRQGDNYIHLNPIHPMPPPACCVLTFTGIFRLEGTWWPSPPPPCASRAAVPKVKSNGGSTPTQCLDKVVHACDTHDSKASAGLEPYTKHGTVHKQLSKYFACPYPFNRPAEFGSPKMRAKGAQNSFSQKIGRAWQGCLG